MFFPVRLSDLDPGRIDPEARQRTLDALEQYKKAQTELERVCKEQGIEVPVMYC